MVTRVSQCHHHDQGLVIPTTSCSNPNLGPYLQRGAITSAASAKMALLVHRQSLSSYPTCIRTVLRFYSTQRPFFFNPNSAIFWKSAQTPEQIPTSRGLPEVGRKSLECLLQITENFI